MTGSRRSTLKPKQLAGVPTAPTNIVHIPGVTGRKTGLAAAKLHKKGAAGKAPLTATASVDEWFDASSSEDDGESSSKTVSKSAASTTGSRAGTRRGKEWQKVALPSVSMDGYSAKRKSLPATTTGKVESGENDESAAVEDKENVEMLAEDEAAVDYDDNADVGDDEASAEAIDDGSFSQDMSLIELSVAQEEEVVTAPATAPTPTRRRKSSIAMNVVELPTVKEEEVEPVSISVMEPLVEQEEPVAANGIVSGEASPDKLVSSISRRDSMRRQASRRVSFAADINALPKSEGESNADDELMPKRKSSGRMSIAEPTAFEESQTIAEAAAAMDGDDIPWNNDDGDDYGADMAGFDGQEDEAPVDEPTPIVTEPSLTKSATTKARRPRTFKQPLKMNLNAGFAEVKGESGEVVRRSTRKRYEPLEYWRNERVVYGRRKSGPCPVPVVQGIIRVPHDSDSDSDTAGKKTTKKRKTSKGKAASAPVPNPKVKFLHPETKEEMEKHLIASSGSVKLNHLHNESCMKGEAIHDPTSSLASGFFHFPKPSSSAKGAGATTMAEKFVRNSGNISIMCYVIAGTMRVTLHETSFTVERGGCFCIPKGNQYELENVGHGEGKIFYVNERSVKSHRKEKSNASSSSSATADV